MTKKGTTYKNSGTESSAGHCRHFSGPLLSYLIHFLYLHWVFTKQVSMFLLWLGGTQQCSFISPLFLELPWEEKINHSPCNVCGRKIASKIGRFLFNFLTVSFSQFCGMCRIRSYQKESISALQKEIENHTEGSISSTWINGGDLAIKVI